MGSRTKDLKIVLIITFVALGFPACTGGTEATTAPPVPANPRAGIIQQIDQLCLDLYKKQQNVLWPDGAAEAVRYQHKQADLVRDFLRKLDEIEVPEEDKQHLDRMKGLLRRAAAGYDRLATAVSDPDRFEELFDPLENLVHRVNVAAFKYGLVDCADPRPARVY